MTWREKTILKDLSREFDHANPDHYRRGGGKETIVRMEETYGAEGLVSGCMINAFKYRDRAGKKGDAEVDIHKARWYEQMAMHLVWPELHNDPRLAVRNGHVVFTREDLKRPALMAITTMIRGISFEEVDRLKLENENLKKKIARLEKALAKGGE